MNKPDSHIHKLIDSMTCSNTSFAIYRLPWTDIPLLVDYFIDQICAETGMQKRKVEPDALKLLVDKSWSGNIRELRNVVERLLILSGSSITAQDVKDYVY